MLSSINVCERKFKVNEWKFKEAYMSKRERTTNQSAKL